MAKKDSKFNFSGSPAANEIEEEMTSLSPKEDTTNHSANVKLKARKRNARTNTEEWTLVQCRLPNDLNRRMTIYAATNDVTKNDFMAEAIRLLLDHLKA